MGIGHGCGANWLTKLSQKYVLLDINSPPVASTTAESGPPGWEAQKIFDVTKEGEEWDHIERKIKATCQKVKKTFRSKTYGCGGEMP